MDPESNNQNKFLNAPIGNLKYRSYEMINNDYYDFSTDIYSFGKSFLELVIGNNDNNGKFIF